MDARIKDAGGRTICPECNKHYKPVLGDRSPNIPIQHQFPHSTPEQREQLMTGLCSTKCWNKHLGIDVDSGNCRVMKHFIKG